MWPWKRKSEEPVYDGPLLCICGKEMRICEFDFWDDQTNSISNLVGVYSCPTIGCSGNCKEYQEKRLAAMTKLTEEEKMVLGLWNRAPRADVTEEKGID